ncbi:hypothetical protein EI94DRAFT_1698817 [Lactarius quietus]|nr:hypothetical protein EI94DRAFT_1698817 [Lactarius quietus]
MFFGDHLGDNHRMFHEGTHDFRGTTKPLTMFITKTVWRVRQIGMISVEIHQLGTSSFGALSSPTTLLVCPRFSELAPDARGITLLRIFNIDDPQRSAFDHSGIMAILHGGGGDRLPEEHTWTLASTRGYIRKVYLLHFMRGTIHGQWAPFEVEPSGNRVISASNCFPLGSDMQVRVLPSILRPEARKRATLATHVIYDEEGSLPPILPTLCIETVGHAPEVPPNKFPSAGKLMHFKAL